MKKMLALFACTLLLRTTVAFADDLGVQVIGGQNATSEIIALDDMVLNETYVIEGYAKASPFFYSSIDVFPQYTESCAGDNSISEWGPHKDPIDPLVRYGQYNWSGAYVYYFDSIQWIHSGQNAEFVWLLMDITNMQKEPYNFMEFSSIKVVFSDEFEFEGWVRQFNYDYDVQRAEDAVKTFDYHPKNDEAYGTFIRAAIAPDDEEAIDMMYTGHYVFGCTLPNAVIDGNEPLRIEIKLGDNELTYHIRK